MSSADPVTRPRETLRSPFRLERICVEKVWGGRALEQILGLSLDCDGPVGETWELVDRASENSVVRDGPHQGRRLRELMALDGEALLGGARATADGRFPLLIKFISATRPLSVQVHPDDRAAEKLHAGEAGKNEAWLILHAEPGSLVYLGLQPGVGAAEFAGQADSEAVVDLLRPWPVTAGDFIHVPAGTLHAIGEGITLLEVQQNSDVTYRLYDWGRTGLDGKPRQTHLEQALLSIDYERPIDGPAAPVLESCGGGNRGAVLLDEEYFGMSLLEVGSHFDCAEEACTKVYVVIEGEGRLWISDAEEPWSMSLGDTWVVPASVGEHRIEARGELVKVVAVNTKA